ncbi:MAG TPA: DUF4407 domain-containing protein [Candidatus Saccharimonadales bacterium]|nr:DUF4407 domain-containing protein [Candidatus Saccharimonadales bacterium]
MSAFLAGRPEPRDWRATRRWAVLRRIGGGQERLLAIVPWEGPRLAKLGGLMVLTASVSGISAYCLVSILRGSFSPALVNVGVGTAAFLVALCMDMVFVHATSAGGHFVVKGLVRVGYALCSALVCGTILVSAIFSQWAVTRLADAFDANKSRQLAVAQVQLRADTDAATRAIAGQVDPLQAAISQLQGQDAAALAQVTADEQACRDEIAIGDPAEGRGAGFGQVATALCSRVAADQGTDQTVDAQNNPVITSDEKTVEALQGQVTQVRASGRVQIDKIQAEVPPSEASLGFWPITEEVFKTVPAWWLAGLEGLFFFLDLAPLLVVAAWGQTDIQKLLEHGSSVFEQELNEESERAREDRKARRKARRAVAEHDTAVVPDTTPQALPPVVRLDAARAASGSVEMPRPEDSEVMSLAADTVTKIWPAAPIIEVAKRELHLGRPLGRGGYFEVYHASFVNISGDEAARHPLGVAAKMVRPEFAGHSLARQLLNREIRFYAELPHLDCIPRVVLWDPPSESGDGCLVLEYFPLGTLAQWGTWAPGDLTARIVLAGLLNLVDAEAELWRRHRSHGDTKPHNVGICGRPGDRLFEFAWPYITRAPGSLVLFDFNGVGQLGQPPNVRSGAYTPPELRGDAPAPGVLSVESDVCAIALTIWTMATGGLRPPIDSYSDAVSLPQVRDVNPMCPEALSSLLNTFMDADLNRRLAMSSPLPSWDVEAKVSRIRHLVHGCYRELCDAGEQDQVVWSAGATTELASPSLDSTAEPGNVA